MGLKSAFQKAALTGIKAAGDVIVTAQYYQAVSTVYDASTGVASAIVHQHITDGLWSRFSADKIDDEKILPTDVKFIVPRLGFKPDIPSTHDFVRIVEQQTSSQYDVVNYDKDPAEAIFIIQLRKS